MELEQLLDERKDEILAQAGDALNRARLRHYGQAGTEVTQLRLQTLYQLMALSVRERDLSIIVSYAEQLAEERFAAGYDLLEVQIAFNALEEVIWKEIIAEVPPEDLSKALGLISTVHGAGKDALARKYVALASKSKPVSLNLSALFAGTDGV